MIIAALGFLLVVLLVYKFGALVSSGLIHYFYPEPDAPGIGRLSPEEYQNIQQVFFTSLFRLLGAVAKCDGRIDESEVSLTESYIKKMDLNADQRQKAIDYFKEGAGPSFDCVASLADFEVLSQRNPNMVEILLVYLVNLARIDGILSDAEMKLLGTVANALGYTSIAFEHLVRMIASQNRFSDIPKASAGRKDKTASGTTNEDTQGASYEDAHNDLQAAYEALGLDPSASFDEVKKSYRRLVNQYHPDKLAGQGVPDFMVRAATERTKKIHAAYNYIKKFTK